MVYDTISRPVSKAKATTTTLRGPPRVADVCFSKSVHIPGIVAMWLFQFLTTCLLACFGPPPHPRPPPPPPAIFFVQLLSLSLSRVCVCVFVCVYVCVCVCVCRDYFFLSFWRLHTASTPFWLVYSLTIFFYLLVHVVGGVVWCDDIIWQSALLAWRGSCTWSECGSRSALSSTTRNPSSPTAFFRGWSAWPGRDCTTPALS